MWEKRFKIFERRWDYTSSNMMFFACSFKSRFCARYASKTALVLEYQVG